MVLYTLRNRLAGAERDLCFEGSGQRNNCLEFRVYLSREEASHCRGVFPNYPRKLSLRHPGLYAEVIELAHDRVHLVYSYGSSELWHPRTGVSR